MKKQSDKQKGFGVIAIIILLALLIAAFTAYSYFNPNFSLAKYSPLHFIADQRDVQRQKDLASLQDALNKYYSDHENSYPASIGTCGRITSILHSDVLDALSPYFPDKGVPGDPAYKGTFKDYFYARTQEGYVLMAVMENPQNIPDSDKDLYNFKGCYDWPGDNVYNYRVTSDN